MCTTQVLMISNSCGYARSGCQNEKKLFLFFFSNIPHKEPYYQFSDELFYNLWLFKVQASGGHVEKYARLIVSGACRGDDYVRFPSWYDIFLLYRVFAPKVLNWTFRLLITNNGARRTSLVGMGRPFIEGSPPRKLLTSPHTFSQQQQPKLE